MIGKAITALLTEDPVLGPLFEEAPGVYRVSPHDRVIGDDLPAATYQRISGAPLMHLRGALPLTIQTEQVSYWTRSYQQAVTIAGRARRIAAGFSGQVAGIIVISVHIDTEQDSYERPQSGQSRGLIHWTQDWRVAFTDPHLE